MFIKHLLQLGGACSDVVSPIVGKVAQLVGGNDDCPSAVCHGQLGHLERCLPVGRAIVDPRKQMAMDVYKTV
jgi:hypothetical protein